MSLESQFAIDYHTSNCYSLPTLERLKNILKCNLNPTLSIREAYPGTTFRAETSTETQGSEWVRLQSTDGFSYLVRRKVAQASGTIRNMLDSEGVCPFYILHFSLNERA